MDPFDTSTHCSGTDSGELHQRLVAATRRLEFVYRSAPVMLHAIDPAGHLSEVSDIWLQKLGYRREEVIGRPLADFLSPESRARALGEVLPGFFGTGNCENVACQLVRRDGSWMDVLLSAVLERDGSGAPVRSLAVLIDVTERNRAERALAESEARYRLLVEDQTELVSLSAPDGTFLFVNQAYARHLGRRPEDLVGANLFDAIPAEERETVRARRQPVWQRGETSYGENHLQGKPGTGLWIGWTNRALTDGSGAIIGVHSVGRDITERKALEDQLNTTMREVIDLYDHAPCGYHSVGPDGTYYRINATELKWLGCRRFDVIGNLGPADFCSPAHAQEFRAAFERASSGAGTQRIEVILLGRSGAPRAVAIDMDAVFDEEGHFLMTRGVMFDVTARREAEVRLSRSERLLAQIGTIAGIGGWKLDVRSGAFVSSEQCRELLGLGHDSEPALAEMLALFAPESQAELRLRLDDAMRRGQGFDFEARVQRADGRSGWVRTVASVELEEGQPATVIGAMQDVTAARAQLRRIESLYETSESQRTELVSFRQRAETEAEAASFLLSRLNRVEHLDTPGVRHFWLPAETFSGDVIAAARSGTGDLYGMLADATGHGLAAAINLIPLTSAFYAMAAKGFNLRTIAEQLNAVVKDYSTIDRFVAVTLARFVERGGQLEVVNAGNPAAVLLDGRGTVLREFRSGGVPLGILPRNRYRPVIETVALSGGEELLMVSDGLVEACDPQGIGYGAAGLRAALASAGLEGDAVGRIRQSLMVHLGGAAPADDVSVLGLLYDPSGADIGTPGKETTPDASSASPAAGRAATGQAWKTETTLRGVQLRSIELVPVLVDFVRSLGLPGSIEARFFTVLTELFVNALDHGLLGLDSTMKASPEGFAHYFELRAARLAGLVDGQVTVEVEHTSGEQSDQWIRLSVTDSGPGFDHRSLLAILAVPASGAHAIPCGRGLSLILSLCEEVGFNDSGNAVTVRMRVPACLPDTAAGANSAAAGATAALLRT